ncbi:MAG: prolipoprotein diacylglyceryl transferase [Bacilli bacterium]|nr:prolipoprotein diacylglyceryl transferase [Bacilli bacterium]
MSAQTLIFILLGAMVMFVVFLIFKKDYSFSILTIIFATIALTIAGVLSVIFMYLLENGKIGGVSFFGAVLFLPLMLWPISKLIKVDSKTYYDLSAAAVCGMLMVMKINCLISGCCGGKIIGYNSDNTPIVFPSQIAEMINAFLIMDVLIFIIKKRKLKGMIFPLFMVLYGFSRFILNLFRDAEDAIFGLPIGNFWAIVSFIIGIAIIIIYLYKSKHKKYQYY